MIFLIVSDSRSERHAHIDTIVASLSGSEVLLHDDTDGAITDLEQYIHPSLFSSAPPVLHLKFMLASNTENITAQFLKKLLASPTIFLFEEMSLAAPLITLFKKTGALVHMGSKQQVAKKDADIFIVTNALTAIDKKSRWLAYRTALQNHSIEAVVGILYWKIRDLASKNQKTRSRYQELYSQLLAAHARAWETGAPLELLIEKVILTQ